MGQGFDHAFYTHNNARPTHHNPVNFFRNGDALGELEGYSCQLVVDEALRWLEEEDRYERPFYLNVWFNEPHDKEAAPPELVERHAYRGVYHGCIENMDLAVGRILAFLEEKALEEDTIVLFTSDNGSVHTGSNQPLRGKKSFTYEGGVRVPFVVRWPGSVPAGSISRYPGSFADVLPTLASLLGAALPTDRRLDGIDLSPVLLEPDAAGERDAPIFFYRYFHDPVCMLREGDWVLLGYVDEPPGWQADYRQWTLAKLRPGPDAPRWSNWSYRKEHHEQLVRQQVRHFELYDIRADVSQRHDVAAEHPERLRRMKRTMLDLRREMIAEGGDWFAPEG
jgi:arylsulfatase A